MYDYYHYCLAVGQPIKFPTFYLYKMISQKGLPRRMSNVSVASLPKDCLMSCDHSNSDCYWQFIGMLKTVLNILRIAKKMF